VNLIRDDIWGYLKAGYQLVVTTNIGWEPRSGRNNMGAGLVWQAAKLWPELPAWYGQTLRAVLGVQGYAALKASEDPVQQYVPPIKHPRLPVIFLPVKPIHPEGGSSFSPAQEANLALIEHGVARLNAHPGEIVMTLPGCGNGGLRPAQVLPILRKYLTDERFLVADQELPAWATGEIPEELPEPPAVPDAEDQPGAYLH
jgi:hypothetical protein